MSKSKPELLSTAVSQADPDLLRVALTDADPKLLEIALTKATPELLGTALTQGVNGDLLSVRKHFKSLRGIQMGGRPKPDHNKKINDKHEPMIFYDFNLLMSQPFSIILFPDCSDPS